MRIPAAQRAMSGVAKMNPRSTPIRRHLALQRLSNLRAPELGLLKERHSPRFVPFFVDPPFPSVVLIYTYVSVI